MNTKTCIFFSLLLLIISIVIYQKNSKTDEIPSYEETWWGPIENKIIKDETIKPFEIEYSDVVSYLLFIF